MKNIDLTWDILLEFETRDLVELHYVKRHGKTPSATKIKEITANFIQAREYFKNYEQANLTVKPLLLYYGVLALSRGLILYSTHELSESSLKPSHGLEVNNWQKAFADKDFLSLNIKIGTGAFSQLLNATENRTYIYHKSSALNWSYSDEVPKTNCEVVLLDLIKCLPDLNNEHELATGEKFLVIPVEQLSTNNEGKTLLTFYREFTFAPNLIPGFGKTLGDNKVTGFRQPDTIEINKENPMHFSQKWLGAFDIGDLAATKSMSNDTYINDIGKSFILSYVLGMTARYFPNTWISLSRTEKGDKVYPLILAILKHIHSKYPRQILDFLKSPYGLE